MNWNMYPVAIREKGVSCMGDLAGAF